MQSNYMERTMSTTECECPLKPGHGSANTRDQALAAQAAWEREHGNHPWAKQRDALAEDLMPALESALRKHGAGPRQWRQLVQIVGALAVVLVVSTARAEAPRGVGPEAWAKIVESGEKVAKATGTGACGAAWARLLLWRALDALDNYAPTVTTGSSRYTAQTLRTGAPVAAHTRPESSAPGGAEERVRQDVQRECRGPGGPGQPAQLRAWTDAHPRWEDGREFGLGDLLRGVTALGVGLGAASEAATGALAPIIIVPPRPERNYSL